MILLNILACQEIIVKAYTYTLNQVYISVLCPYQYSPGNFSKHLVTPLARIYDTENMTGEDDVAG